MRKLFQATKHLKYPIMRRITALILVVFLIAAAVGGVCRLLIMRLNETLHQQQLDRMSYLELELDQQMENLSNTLSQITANNYLQILAKSSDPLTPHQRSLLIRFNREFSQYVAANSLWSNTMLYFSRSNQYQEGIYARSAEELYKAWDYAISFEEWQMLLNTTNTTAWRTFLTGSGQLTTEIWFPLGATQKQESLGILVIRLNRTQLLAFLAGTRFFAEERILLLDAQGAILCDTGENTPEEKCSRVEITNSRTGWRLVSLLDTNDLEAPARLGLTLSLVLCAGLLVVGTVAGVISSIRTFAPIERLYNLASEKQEITASPHSTKEAVDLMETNFRALIERHDNAQLRLLHQQRYVRDHLLSRLMKATWAGESAFSPAIFQENGITFPSNSVFLLRVLCMNREETPEISQIRINSMLEEMLREPYQAMFFIYDMNSLGIVSLPQGMAFEDAVQDIRVHCLRLAEQLKSIERIDLAFICSRQSVAITQLPGLYDDLTRAEDYFQPSGMDDRFRSADEISTETSGTAHSRMVSEVRKTLWKAIEEEEYTQAISLIRQVYEQDKKQYGEASDVLFSTILNIAAITMTAMQINADSEKNDLLERLHAQQRLLACSTIPALYRELIQVLSEVCVSSDKKTAPRRRILYEIRRFVDANFSDANLCVSDLADRAGMSISSLSRAFKREMGYNLLDYINKIRVEAVIHSLTETDDALERIAERTGYINVNTLIRNFKRYVGMTPGKYKQSLVKSAASEEGTQVQDDLDKAL